MAALAGPTVDGDHSELPPGVEVPSLKEYGNLKSWWEVAGPMVKALGASKVQLGTDLENCLPPCVTFETAGGVPAELQTADTLPEATYAGTDSVSAQYQLKHRPFSPRVLAAYNQLCPTNHQSQPFSSPAHAAGRAGAEEPDPTVATAEQLLGTPVADWGDAEDDELARLIAKLSTENLLRLALATGASGTSPVKTRLQREAETGGEGGSEKADIISTIVAKLHEV